MPTLADEITVPAEEPLGPQDWVRAPMLSRSASEQLRGFWYCFGGLTFATAILQALSGMVLAFYYQPTPERAYASIYYISSFVKYGWFIRSIHVWGSRLMVVFIVIHMLRVYVTASYKHPRELNWVAGVFLFVITMAFGLTGSLLPWDQEAYWGTAGAISFIEKTPLVGERLSYFIVGGHTIGAAALSRFYSGHIMMLPAVLAAFLLAHFWMVRKQGISEPL